MAKAKAAWGLEMGNCALKAVKIRLQNNVPEVVAFDIVEHGQILSQPEIEPEQRDELILESLEKFLERNPTQGDEVCISVPGQQTFSRFTKLPPVEEKKIPDIVNFEAGQQIPFDIDEVVWDYQAFREEDSPDVEVGIFAMKKELIGRHLHSFTSKQLEPSVVQAAPLALYNFLRYDQTLGENATILIDIGTLNTDLVVSYGQTVWTRSIPLGGNNFTDALVKAFKLSFNKAENLKRTAATSKYARQIFQAMRPVFADLVSEVQRSIGFYTSTHREVEMGKVIGVGNAFRLPGLQKYLQQNLQLEVERLSEFKKLNIAPTLKAPQFSEHVLSFPVSYGLALQGLDSSTIASNLLPTEIARSVIWRKKRPFFAAAAACVLLAAGAMWARYSMDRAAIAQNVGDIQGTAIPKVSLTQAYEAMANPQTFTPEGIAPRAYTVKWLGVASAMSSELQRIRGKGDAELKKAQQISELLAQRGLVPRILTWLAASLPTPQPPFDQPGDASELAEQVERFRQAGKLLPRNARRQILIEECSLDYADNVWEAVSGRGDFSPPAQRSGKSKEAGFIISLLARTPNEKGPTFVSQEFQPRLEELGSQPGLGFHVLQTSLDWRQRVGAGQRPTGPSVQPGFPTTPGVSEVTIQRRRSEPGTVDPVTGESVTQDWVFRMTIRLGMGDAKPKEKPAEAGSD